MATTTDGRPEAAMATTWRIERDHSRVEFTADKRLAFIKKLQVTGRFAAVEGTIVIDEGDPARSRVEVTIGAASVATRQARRDAHLLQAAFFDAERYPALTFRSRAVAVLDRADGRYRVTGDLTIRDVTRPVTLDVTAEPAPTGAGQSRRRFTSALTLNRRDFGIAWNSPLIRVADAVRITLDIQATPA